MKMHTLREAADVARISEGFLLREIRAGIGPAVVKPGLPGGKRMLVTDDALASWFEARTIPAGSAPPKPFAK